MEELIDVYNEYGNKTGDTIKKVEAHEKGIWHSSIHILIINKSKTKILLQKRCKEKSLYPNKWDISVGGHIAAGEDDITSAKRELKEELGLNPNNYNIRFIKRFKETLINNNVYSNEFVSIFIIIDDIDISDLTLQKEEVSKAKWVSKKELNNLIENKSILPHKEDYKILNNILV